MRNYLHSKGVCSSSQLFKAGDVNHFYFLKAEVLKCFHVSLDRFLSVDRCFPIRESNGCKALGFFFGCHT